MAQSTSRPTAMQAADKAPNMRAMQESAPHDLVHFLKQFAEENPTSAALWCLGVGFVLGWKLKPW